MREHDDNRATERDAPHRDRRNQRGIVLWSVIWATAFIVASLSIARDWSGPGVTVTAVIVTSLFGVATLLAYRRFLRETDELRRKIEVEALALAFGVGVVGGLSYWLLVVAGIVSEAGFGFVYGAMILTHPVGVALGRRRYA